MVKHCGLLLFVVAVSTLPADQIVLSNGDRVTGEIVESDAEVLKVTTELMGDIEIKWEAVTEITADEKLFISSTDGQVLVGPVKTSDESFEVQTEQSGAVKVPKAEVAAVRNEEAQTAYEAAIERLRNPKLTDNWSGFFDTGFSLTAGNARTKSFTNTARAARTSQRDEISLYATTVFADNSTTGESITTANAIRGGTRYDVNVSDKLFTFGFLDLEFDEFQDLDLRSVVGGGLGYRLKDSERISWDFFSGGSLNQEFFRMDITRRSGEVVFGEELTINFTEKSAWTHRLAVYPNLSEGGEFRLQFDSSLNNDIWEWLGWHVTVSDRYLSNPVPGRKTNDVLLTTGLRLSFGE